MNTVIYARSSGYVCSLDDQIAACTSRASREGWQIVDVFTDRAIGESIASSERPGMAAMLARVQAADIDQVLIVSLDRLARNIEVGVSVLERLSSAGTRLLTLVDDEITDISSAQRSSI